MSYRRPRDPQPVSRATLDRFDVPRENRVIYRKREKKPVPVKNKPGWFEDRR